MSGFNERVQHFPPRKGVLLGTCQCSRRLEPALQGGLGRIERLNPIVNAYCTLSIDTARAALRAEARAERAATALGIPAGTVRSRHHYALRALRVALVES